MIKKKRKYLVLYVESQKEKMLKAVMIVLRRVINMSELQTRLDNFIKKENRNYQWISVYSKVPPSSIRKFHKGVHGLSTGNRVIISNFLKEWGY